MKKLSFAELRALLDGDPDPPRSEAPKRPLSTEGIRPDAGERKVLCALRKHRQIDTITLRHKYDVLSPAVGVHFLRKQGHHILTHWVMIPQPWRKQPHRVAQYVYLSGPPYIQRPLGRPKKKRVE